MKNPKYPKEKSFSRSNSYENKMKNNNKSRSKSPIPRCSKSPSNFYFKQKSCFLTYPHVEKSGMTKEDLGNYLYDTFKCSVTVVCLEHHKDGNPHLHAWIEWEEQFFTRNIRLFDYKGQHPNIGRMQDKRKNTRNNALTYMMKEDNNLFVKGIDLEQWKYSCKNKTKYMYEDLIKGNIQLNELVEKQPQLLMNYNRLKINLEAYNLDKKENLNIMKTNENLWIFGHPGTGKTYYATHLYPKFYMKQQNKWWDGYKGEEVVILDDLDDASMSHYIKIWADNYNTTGEIKNGTIQLNFKVFIITSNYMPRNLWKNDKQVQYAICRRFNFITVMGQYPNFKRVPLPNPITNPF